MLRAAIFMISAMAASVAHAQDQRTLTDVLDDTRDLVLELRTYSALPDLPTPVKRRCFVLANELYGFTSDDASRVDLSAGFLEGLCEDARRRELEFMGMMYVLESVEPETIRYTNAPSDAVIEFKAPTPIPQARLDPASIAQCWNVGSLSTDALQAEVVVSFYIDKAGNLVPGTIALDESNMGVSGPGMQAFEAARRAIIRCGARGFGDVRDQIVALKFAADGIDLTEKP